MKEGCWGARAGVCCLQHSWIWRALFALRWAGSTGGRPGQYWDGKCRNAKAGGQIQGLVPHMLPFSLPQSLQCCWCGPAASREVGRMWLECREHPVPFLACTNGSWKGKGSLTVPLAGRLLQAQLRSCRNTLHCFLQRWGLGKRDGYGWGADLAKDFTIG